MVNTSMFWYFFDYTTFFHQIIKHAIYLVTNFIKRFDNAKLGVIIIMKRDGVVLIFVFYILLVTNSVCKIFQK